MDLQKTASETVQVDPVCLCYYWSSELVVKAIKKNDAVDVSACGCYGSAVTMPADDK